MPKVFIYDGNMPRETIFVHEARRRYGFLRFCGDLFMTGITGGLWLVWIFVREMRRR